ncbi:PqiC family protein [Caballeronia sordidicola]|uniref:ABC-type transport auxiliary lipoprotein component domain-containing protein n=1 Tax=Caballeronia sordidicola TaxID=196367 RepID=A0A242M5X6_CABSO|nr:PqiC family protein [Caballeronia sordidicola]OTP66596.1 hypothetical protein PAMC26577_37540 [Caballeronia sordidicola]
MMKSSHLLAASLLLALTACSSVPVHYHTLLSPQSDGGGMHANAPFLLNVLPVGIPAQLDQSYLVVRQGQSGVEILDNERWTSAFGDEVRSALSAQLTSQLATRDIAGLAASVSEPVITLKVQIRRFDAWPNRAVQLEATWSLGRLDGTGTATRIGQASLSEAAPGDYTALVNAQQDVLRQLAGKIASDAKDWSTFFYR